jgi:hypothetical protein
VGFNRFLRKIRKQTAAVWLPAARGDDGERGYDPPIDIKCRWEDYAGEDADAKGRMFHSRARIIVDRLLVVGAVIKMPDPELALTESAVDNLVAPTGTDPFGTESDVYEIRKLETVPFKNPGPGKYHYTVVVSGRNEN